MREGVPSFCNGSSAPNVSVLPLPVHECPQAREGHGDLQFPDYIRNTTTAFSVVILVIGVTGNLIVPVVVCRTKELRNSTNLFLINLSVADLLLLIVCMPTVLIELHSEPEVWTLGEGMCKAVPYMELTVAHGSILTMLAISFERYYAICRPLKASYTCTKMRALAIIVAVWLVAVLVTSPVLAIVEYTHTMYIDGREVPVCLTSAHTTWQRVYFFLAIAFLFFFPFGVLVALYGVIAKRLVLDQQVLPSFSIEPQRARRQVVLMLAVVIACFFVCLMPFRVFTLWLLVVSSEDLHQLGMEGYYNVLYFCRIMLYINSASNPVLYNLISSKFRDAFIRLFCRKRLPQLSRQATFNTTYTSVTVRSTSPCQMSACYHSTCPIAKKCEESYV